MSNGKSSSAASRGWFISFLLSALLAGCGSGGGDGVGTDSGTGSAAPGVTAAPGSAGTAGAAATNPTVGSASPGNGASNVPVGTNSSGNTVTGTTLTANFSEQMNPATVVAPATFTLVGTANGANVPGTVTMNGGSTSATFTPTALLLPNTSYTATISTAATNAAGVPMPNPISWTFMTRASGAIAQAPVVLGLAGTYAIFANTGIANATVPAAITGDMGVGPGVTSTAITGFALNLAAGAASSTSAQVTGNIYAFDYAAPTPTNVTTASNDMGTAYTDAAGRLLPDFVDVAVGNLGGQTLTPGLHRYGSNVTLPFGTDVTLSGGADDVWIIQITGTLTTGAATNVFLSGGAQARNVFWQVAGTSVTLGANARFEGIVLAQNAINLGNQASAGSRLLAQTAVNLDQNAIVQPAP